MTTSILDKINHLLADAERCATLENAGFGFSVDRIEIKSVHFGDDTKGRVGDVLHPDEYIKRIVKLHHQTWIIAPLRQARELIQAHAELLERAQALKDLLDGVNFERIDDLLRACRKD